MQFLFTMYLSLDSYTNHTEWYLESGTFKRNVVKYACCPEPFPDVTITLVLRRRSLFYLLNLIFPMVVISMLTMLSFYLPAESGKVQLIQEQKKISMDKKFCRRITVLSSFTLYFSSKKQMIKMLFVSTRVKKTFFVHSGKFPLRTKNLTRF